MLILPPGDAVCAHITNEVHLSRFLNLLSGINDMETAAVKKNVTFFDGTELSRRYEFGHNFGTW